MNVTTMGPERNPTTQINNQPLNLEWPQVVDGQAGSRCSGDLSHDDKVAISLSAQISELTNSQAKIREESTKKALILKRKELRWKLMQASQAQNQAKLVEIKTSLNYHRQKLSKAQALAAKLREKYVKVVRSAKVSEEQYKTAQTQLALQEKHVADEKMQLTKLAMECINTGTSLYGSDYKLPDNPNQSHKTKYSGLKTSNQINMRSSDIQSRPSDDSTTQETKEEILKKLSPFLRKARAMASVNQDDSVKTKPRINVVIDDNVVSNVIRPKLAVKKRKRTAVSRLSSLIDLNDSVLKNLASYRLTRKFADLGTTQLTDLAYSHNIQPLEYVCFPDLLGECSDKSCPYQHKSNYFMTDLEKLTDLLSYRPEAAGWVRGDDDLNEEENYRVCRVKLKQYAAKLISKNADKPVEMIARAIISDIRNNHPDVDLLLMRRQLPKTVHLNKPQEQIEGTCGEAVPLSMEITDDTNNVPEDPSNVVTMDSQIVE
uniref:Zinc-finger domain-containing protein n=1 Tax=Aceria tosichella TaxID=561515 RepID=A0A6G1SLC8_9ACAR